MNALLTSDFWFATVGTAITILVVRDSYRSLKAFGAEMRELRRTERSDVPENQSPSGLAVSGEPESSVTLEQQQAKGGGC
jgi:hypothetical protein